MFRAYIVFCVCIEIGRLSAVSLYTINNFKIKIFRKLRSKFLLERKVQKYLLYALGEILLVMIGILLAVQVNNSIQDRKNQKILETYLGDLKSDLDSDISKLQRNIKSNENRVAQIDTILMTYATNNNLSKTETLKFYGRHLTLISESYFIPERSTIKQIESSSHGALIEKELRDKIFRYYTAQYKNEMNNERSIQLYMHNYNTPNFAKLFSNGDVLESFFGSSLGRMTDTDYREYIKDDEYLAALVLRRGNCTTQNGGYNRLLGFAEELVELIDKEPN